MAILGITEAHGHTVHGTTVISTIHGIMQDGMTLGITEVSMILGTMAGMATTDFMDTPDGTAASTAHITADGTEHGTHIGVITTIITLSTGDTSRMTAGMAADTPPELTECSRAGYPPEVESEPHPEFPEARPAHLYPEQQQAVQARVQAQEQYAQPQA